MKTQIFYRTTQAKQHFKLAQWALDGTLDLAGMVTRTAPLDAWEDALRAMRAGDVIRTVLLPEPVPS